MNTNAPRWKCVPVRELIAVHASRLDLPGGNKELAQLLGFKSGNIVSMLKAGTLRLSMSKVPRVAEVLGIDKMYLARCVDAEADGSLATLFDEMGEVVSAGITQNELALLYKLREVGERRDFDVSAYPEQLEQIVQAYATAAKRDQASFDADLERSRAKSHSAAARGARDTDDAPTE